MSEGTFETLSPLLGEGIAEGDCRPWYLIFSKDQLVQARAKATEIYPELCQRIRDTADQLLNNPELFTLEGEPYYSLPDLAQLAEAQLLQPDKRYVEAILKLMHIFAEAPSWVATVHKHRNPNRKCDHCSPNTAAALVLAMEVLGSALNTNDEEFFTSIIYERCLRPFLDVCEGRSDFWAQRDHRFNQRMMVCGEAGLAAIGLKQIPDKAKIITFALEGVSDMLDNLPEEGDFEDGPGYWGSVLYFGLRFARALCYTTDGRIDLFHHPRLLATANYFTHMTLPDGRVFNYSDNPPRISPVCLYYLARELRSETLAWSARRMDAGSIEYIEHISLSQLIPYGSFWNLLFDDETIPSHPPGNDEKSKVFPTSEIAVSRSDWSDQALYVGFKSGPISSFIRPTEIGPVQWVGHAHQDIQSFIVSKGKSPLIVDSGVWPYAHFLGHGDHSSGQVWCFDDCGTIGYNTVLIDGRGMTGGPYGTGGWPGPDERPSQPVAGKFSANESSNELNYVISDAASLYPGLISRFDRWLIFINPDIIIVYDNLVSDKTRYWEWLLHHAGTLTGSRENHLIENEGVALSLKRLLPEKNTPWRISEELRTTYYQDSDKQRDVEQSIRLRRFGPIFPSNEIEFLWVMHLGPANQYQWNLERNADATIVVICKGSERELSLTIDQRSHRCELLVKKSPAVVPQ